MDLSQLDRYLNSGQLAGKRSYAAKPSGGQRAHIPQEAWVAASESVSGYRVVDAFSMFEIYPEIKCPAAQGVVR